MSKPFDCNYNCEFCVAQFCEERKQNVKISPIWIDAKEQEPDSNRIICLYHPNFRDKIIICSEYRPKEKKFYYEDGEYYNDISLNHPNLKWTYVENLIPNE